MPGRTIADRPILLSNIAFGYTKQKFNLKSPANNLTMGCGARAVEHSKYNIQPSLFLCFFSVLPSAEAIYVRLDMVLPLAGSLAKLLLCFGKIYS